MHSAFATLDHRPWPVPTGRWTWRQSWRDLLFAHWPVEVERLRPLVPERLTIQEFDGISWIGVVPFRMAGVMRRPLPDLPWISAFPELNVRLYVELDGRPGVFFLSLDATQPLAVWAAKRFFHLPYHRAQMQVVDEGSHVQFTSQRKVGGQRFHASYGPKGEVTLTKPGSLEHWLTERYCLYAQAPDGRLSRTEVHHPPWPLQQAEATIDENTMQKPFDLEPESPPVLLHFSRQMDVVVWSPVWV